MRGKKNPSKTGYIRFTESRTVSSQPPWRRRVSGPVKGSFLVSTDTVPLTGGGPVGTAVSVPEPTVKVVHPSVIIIYLLGDVTLLKSLPVRPISAPILPQQTNNVNLEKYFVPETEGRTLGLGPNLGHLENTRDPTTETRLGVSSSQGSWHSRQSWRVDRKEDGSNCWETGRTTRICVYTTMSSVTGRSYTDT